MFKRWMLLFFAFLFVQSVIAGELESALNKGNNVFLYLSSAKCKYCDMFNPMYEKAMKTHDGEYSFIKVDTSTRYGHNLMYEYNAPYVPYVVLLNQPKSKGLHIPPGCLIDNACLETAMIQFRK